MNEARRNKLKAEAKRIREELLQIRAMQKEYFDGNLIEFFDKPPNPGPNPLQAELLEAWLDSDYKVYTFSGANRLGKTTIGSLIAISTVIGKYPWSGQRLHIKHNKPRKVRIIGQDWHNQIAKVLVPELKKWWPANRPVKKTGNGIIRDTYWVDEKTGSSIEIMSNLQDSDVHEGWSGDLVIYDEPPKRDIRVANARGLVDREGRELFTMTLLKEAWVSREVMKATLPDGRPDPSVFNVSGDISMNIGFGITREGVDQFVKTLNESEKDARLKGIPSYMSGLVYPEFKRRVHVKKRFDVPLHWMVDVGIDVHPRERQAILFCATDEWNRKWLVDEVWDHGDGTWVGEQVIRKVMKNSYRVNRVIVDPLAKGDQNNPHTVFDKIQEVLFRYNMVLEAATKDKDSGIIETRKCLMGPNGEPSLFVFNDLVRTIWEIEGYMWDQDTQKAIKKDDHMVENLYRLVMLDTRYEDVEDIDDDFEDFQEGRSAIGGY